ncbi:transposase [Hymenobacter gelipurpurascens]|uniref:transposase n=1 Tax=Hymenobacter gelipurpurascens TaxID=89968 RepID=UPI003743246F
MLRAGAAQPARDWSRAAQTRPDADINWSAGLAWADGPAYYLSQPQISAASLSTWATCWAHNCAAPKCWSSNNLPGHKLKGLLQELARRGVKVLFLPPYSPDFTSVEPPWSKLKTKLRQA